MFLSKTFEPTETKKKTHFYHAEVTIVIKLLCLFFWHRVFY